MRITFLCAAALIATPAFADVPTLPRTGQTVRDANSVRVGVIERVNSDGSVRLIVGSRFVTIPASTVSVTASGVQTSMAKKDVAKLQ